MTVFRTSSSGESHKAKSHRVCILLSLLVTGVLSPGSLFAAAPEAVRSFLSANCYDCHEGESAEAGLDLTTFNADLNDSTQFDTWVRLFDRVHDGEMPPADAATVDPEELGRFLTATQTWLRDQQQQQHAQLGRVRARRLTNLQLERTLQDLLAIDIPLARMLPDDPRTNGFSTVAEGQAMSHFQLERQVAVIDAALDEAFRRATSSPDEWSRELDAQEISRRNPKSRTREPEIIDGRAVTWSSGLIFYGRLPATTAHDDGWYRFTIRASALKGPQDHGVWCTVRSGKCVSSAPLLGWVGAFEATEEPQEWTFETWLPDGHMLEVRPGDTTLKKARFEGGQVGTGEGDPQNVPGIAIDWVKMQRIHLGPDNDELRSLLLDDLEVQEGDRRHPGTLVSTQPGEDLTRLIGRFARRAFRRPVDDAELEPFVAMARLALEGDGDLLSALRAGYRALLCSPRFLYFEERPGALDDHAIACRLSYLLWNSMPDDELSQLADVGRLRDPQVLREQVDRMLADRRGQNFVKDFSSEWLDLCLIDFTEPDRRMFPDFDIIVQQSMLDETHAFLDHLLRDNRSVSQLMDSDFTFLNSRLARFYEIDDVEGDELRAVELRPEHRRGGLLTQGAVLKVTANGTTTSPVIRGVWIAERLLGQDVPPPPTSVPAVEPDIRGTTTIREMLAKHRSDSSCASCHVKFDPPGFALENFDPAGQWRQYYRSPDSQSKSRGTPIDASYTLADGREFADVDGFQQLMLDDRPMLARNFAKHLLTYGTGAPISFADRPALDEVVSRTADSDYGLRSLLYAAVASPIFLTK